jgi:acetyl-CoA carboxylase alpha subunit
VLHQLFEPLRECNYEYHRKGLDKLYENKDAARKAMYDALNKLNKVITTRPNSINVLNFVQAKTVELKNLYADSEVKDKNEIVNLLKKIDPANSSKYMEILN